jgi:hypothetical protein
MLREIEAVPLAARGGLVRQTTDDDIEDLAFEEDGVDGELYRWASPLSTGRQRRLALTGASMLGGLLLFGALCIAGGRGLLAMLSSRSDGAAEPHLSARWDAALGSVHTPAPFAPANSQHEPTVKVASQAPLQEFYIFRAYPTASHQVDQAEQYTFGNINARTMGGMMWWLKHAIVTTYTNESMCPRNHNISRIKRFRIRMRATQELFNEHMSMGTLFNYQGKCLGRCFPDGFCTGERDCDFHYHKYGYFPGCNSTHGRYSFPLDGRCQFPTGAHNCTWSFEDAGEVTLELLESTAPATGLDGNCCNGKCTKFWDMPSNLRSAAALDMFAMMYPEQPRELLEPGCDFDWNKWYATDPWQDVWETNTAPAEHAPALQVPPPIVSKALAKPKPLPLPLFKSTATTTTRAMTQSVTTPTWAPVTTTTMAPIVSQAPLQEFYIYRATMKGLGHKYPFGNINAGNLDGVMWYLQNEVVTMYTNGTRCPRKFNISTVKRFKFQTRTTNELYATNLSYGARFSFDQGKCVGRCFEENMCTLGDDCDYHYDKYGYIVGCNSFADKYPFPDFDTPTPGGIWYSLPLQGRCNWPTGSRDCTWSYQEAGEVPLELLEASFPGTGNCCNGVCTDFWEDVFSDERTDWRVEQTLDMFKMMYPEMPRSLNPPPCDFKYTKWYDPEDRWERKDPWAENGFMYK